MLDYLLTEQASSEWCKGELFSTAKVLTAMCSGDSSVFHAVFIAIPSIESVVHAVATALDQGGSLIYVGAGTSGRLGVLDAAECPPTFHTPPHLVRAIIAGGDTALRQSVEGAEDDSDAGVRDLITSGVSSKDAVVGISASGRTPYVLAALAHARSLGAATGGISCVPGAELSSVVEHPIEVPAGPEILAGSTRLRAGTATKLVLNMISTAVMMKLGYTYRGLMINVQPTNRKLEDRARRIIAEITGVPMDRAVDLLNQAGRRVPTAVVMEKRGVSRAEAEKLLSEARGRLDVALGERALGE